MAIFARVVVGVDGTDWGFEALRQALALAPAEDARVEAVTALDTSPAARTGFEAAHWVDVLSEEAKEARDAAATILDDRAGSSARIVRGTPLQVLRHARDEADATLLALGARHSSRFLGIMLGDTASELLHDGSCSVLLARPQREGAWQPRRIVVGLDGSAPALAALATADELASRIGATVEVVCATSDGSRVEDALDRPRGQLGRSSTGRRPRRTLTRGRPRRRWLSRPARPPCPRKRQRESRTPGPLLRPGRARRLTPRCGEAILGLGKSFSENPPRSSARSSRRLTRQPTLSSACPRRIRRPASRSRTGFATSG